MTTTQRIQSAAHLTIAQIWHDLRGEDNNSDNADWEQFFRDEYKELAQEHRLRRYSEHKLISWIRGWANRLYEYELKQPYHIAIHKVGYINLLATHMLSVVSDNVTDHALMAERGSLLFHAYFETACLNHRDDIASEYNLLFNR